MDLTGKTAVVTGAGSGIGAGICRVLFRHGANVALIDIDESTCQKVADELPESDGRTSVHKADVRSVEDIQNIANEIINLWGKVDILVNNAGVYGAAEWFNYDIPREEDWEATYQVNVKGIYKTTDAFSGHMMKNRYGKIINIASIASRRGSDRGMHYNASKAAALSVTQGYALRLAPYNINVNAICPGLLWTPMFDQITARHSSHTEGFVGMDQREIFDTIVERDIPLKREQTPEDIGNVAAFLASDEAFNITGQGINVSGGLFMN